MRAPKEIIALVAPLAILSDVLCGIEEEVGTEDVELKIESIALELGNQGSRSEWWSAPQ